MIKLSVLIVSACLTASAATFTHRFEKVPHASLNCHEVASGLMQLFKTQTGNATGFVACVKDDGKFSDYELTYSAEERLPFATTDVATVYLTGLYSESKACEEALERATRQFENNTKLKAFLAYCEADFNSMNPRWSPLIFAFGVAEKRYWISGYNYFATPYKFDPTAFSAQVKVALEKNGAEFAGGVAAPSFGYGEMAIHYYGKSKVPFELLELSRSPKIEQCLENLDRLNAALNQHLVERVTTYCGQTSLGGGFELTTLFAGRVSASKRVSVESYEKLELCEMDRERLLEVYKKSGDSKIIEGFCHRENSTFNIVFVRSN